MSHFTVAVLVRQDTVVEPGHPEFETQLMSEVTRMLAPFEEELQVTPYQVECSCAEEAINKKALEIAERETGLTWELLRDTWRSSSIPVAWQEHAAPLLSVQESHYHDLLSEACPDTECEDCHGTGVYMSTRNTVAKWDWYSVGGRYSERYAEKGIPAIIPNVAFARDLHTATYAPFAILSPREPHQKQSYDNWNEQGEMGWFAIVSNENENWPAIALELLDKYSGCFAVLMDCHI